MKKIFGLASVPYREKNLEATINSILPQADMIHVFLNNYQFTPYFLQHDKIFVYRSQEHGDKSDAGKFFNVSENCYYFSCDDDLIYPPDYAERMTNRLQEYSGKIIVSHHGRHLKPLPLRSYYRDKTFIHHCLRKEAQERFVHIGGTGVMAFDTNYFQPKPELFKLKHMADIWVAKMAQESKTPILAIEHTSGYIKMQDNIGETIHRKFIHNDRQQTSVCNQIRWILHKAVK